MINILATEPAPDGGINIHWERPNDVEAFTHLTDQLLVELSHTCFLVGCSEGLQLFNSARNGLDVELWRQGMDALKTFNDSLENAKKQLAGLHQTTDGLKEFMSQRQNKKSTNDHIHDDENERAQDTSNDSI